MSLSKIIEQIALTGHKKDQRDTFWDLAQKQTRFLYNVALKYTGNRYDAEDLLQETLSTAYQKFYQLRDRRKFKSWLFTILRNHFLKLKREKAPVELDDFENDIDYLAQLEAASVQQDATLAVEQKIEAETIQSILDKLPDKYQTVLILYYMEDGTYQEIAELLEVPIGTVMSRLSRAKQMMKKALLKPAIKTPLENVVWLNQKR